MLDKAEYSAFQSTLNSPIVSYRIVSYVRLYRVGFSGTADLMALFSIRTNSRWRPPPSWIILNAISPQQLMIYLYSAHRTVIFAIAQLSCFSYSFSYFSVTLVVSVALLVARRTNNRKVVGSIPANAVCLAVDR